MRTLTKNQIIEIARIRIPLVVQAFSEANRELQSSKPDLAKVQELLISDDLDGFYEVSDLVSAWLKLQRSKDD